MKKENRGRPRTRTRQGKNVHTSLLLVSQGELQFSIYVLCTGFFSLTGGPTYSTTARAPVMAGATSPWPTPVTMDMVIDSSRWNLVCLAMNASTVRRNSSASSAPQLTASA
uniref:Uncharacterized protein n=1 Tax=Oryza brachyantha TaxID=4533 RepID=J3MA42_ORYBR